LKCSWRSYFIRLWRIAIPVAADDEDSKSVAMELGEHTGFDGVAFVLLLCRGDRSLEHLSFAKKSKPKYNEITSTNKSKPASHNPELMLRKLGERGGETYA